jgi:hypothetical protein
MIAVFSAPLDLPRSRPVLAVPAPRSQDMRIKYMFIAQRYVYYAAVRPPLPGGGSADRRLSLRYSLMRPAEIAHQRASYWTAHASRDRATYTRHLMCRVLGQTRRQLGAAAGGNDPESWGDSRPVRSSRTLRQTSLLSHVLTAREQHLLTIRTPRTTSSEIAVGQPHV